MASAHGAGQGITAGPSVKKVASSWARLSASLLLLAGYPPHPVCVCGSSDRGRTPRLLLHGDARGFGVVIFGFREGEHQLTFQRLVPQRSCPQQPLPVSSEVSFLELDLVCHTGII